MNSNIPATLDLAQSLQTFEETIVQVGIKGKPGSGEQRGRKSKGRTPLNLQVKTNVPLLAANQYCTDNKRILRLLTNVSPTKDAHNKGLHL